MTARPIVPGSTVGMLGGGQLGRYALMAARQMGYRTVVVDPNEDAPAGAIADVHLVAAYSDPTAVDRLAELCDVVTVEFENPPAAALAALARSTRVAPSAMAFEIAQDRWREKQFLMSIGVDVGPVARLASNDDLAAIEAARPSDGSVVAPLTAPFVVKTARLGYDGKGQRRVATVDQLSNAWAELGRVRCVVESALTFDKEVSVVLARSFDGSMATYAVTENRHVDGILDISVAPARISADVAARATAAAQRIADRLDYVGVLAVEFFVVGDAVLVNELAPRPHNSGHWTIDVAQTSQFEQQIRAICGLQLGDPAITQPSAAMANILGDVWQRGDPDWSAAVRANTAVHLYGKSEPRPGRKMGHLTAWGVGDLAEETVIAARAELA